jgi:hydrogenase maturation protein HypF
MQVRKQIDVSGIVQGVGFRPYVFRLAHARKLIGNVRNTAAGVSIEIQGDPDAVESFVLSLPSQAPPLARIENLAIRELKIQEGASFSIIESQGGEPHTLISPDIAVCDDCIHESFDPKDRRYLYPFINCTNCGPRFTIVAGIPYDRPSTSMAAFTMCPHCQVEYDDPLNRRFHAQPNACPVCGPHVELWDHEGQFVVGDPIGNAIEALRAGRIVAIKGLGGFHLAADALNESAVVQLRERKRRVEKPFAVMVADTRAAQRFCVVTDEGRIQLESIERPIVLLPRTRNCEIPHAIAPGTDELGVFLPYTPLHRVLLGSGGFSALVMTSGNLSEEPIVIDNQEALRRLDGLADLFLVHNRDILLRCDDSVVRPSPDGPRQLRRSRGFVPVPIFLKKTQPSVLAVGGELKNTVCLTEGTHAFLSQHIGDLENVESYGFFEDAIHHLENILEITPEAIACDMHPDYFSTKWAMQQKGLRVIEVQHHHAHIASCMAENRLEGKVIGIALDGTGYGIDKKVWGGEVLIASYTGFERFAHLEYVRLPGGDRAIKEPWRMAVSHLAHCYGPKFLEIEVPFASQLNKTKTLALCRMMERNVNSPLTSSCGRLFDAVAALIGIRQEVNYEAQAAIELQMAIKDGKETLAYPFAFVHKDGLWVMSTRPLFDALIADIEDEVPTGCMSQRFHNGLIQRFSEAAVRARTEHALNRVCLSGGSFNNAYLTAGFLAKLSSLGFEVFEQRQVPCGDGGLSLGQAVIAAHRAWTNN